MAGKGRRGLGGGKGVGRGVFRLSNFQIIRLGKETACGDVRSARWRRTVRIEIGYGSSQGRRKKAEGRRKKAESGKINVTRCTREYCIHHTEHREREISWPSSLGFMS